MKHLCLFHDPSRCEHLLSSQPKPRICTFALVNVGKSRLCLFLIADVEQIAQGFHLISLLSVAQQLTHGKIQVLPQKIQKRTFNRPLCLYHEFQLADVKRLDSLAVVLGCTPASFMYTV